jgi:hypothetical protein
MLGGFSTSGRRDHVPISARQAAISAITAYGAHPNRHAQRATELSSQQLGSDLAAISEGPKGGAISGPAAKGYRSET